MNAFPPTNEVTRAPSSTRRHRSRVLHVEVGGPYGGSLRALEIYLAYSDHELFAHDFTCLHAAQGLEPLRAHAADVGTVYSSDRGPTQYTAQVRAQLRAQLKRSRLTSLPLEIQEWLVLAKSAGAVWRLRRLMRDGNYAVVHVNNTFPYQAATVIAARLSGIPVVAHVRNPVDALAFNRMLMRLIHTIVPVAACYERQLESWNTGARIRTCHDGVEVACPDAAKAAEVRQRLFGAGDTILVGSVGRLTPQKDYHTFVRSARIVADTRPGVRFAVCGDGPDRESLQHLIHQLGLNDKFTLCGFLNPSEAINFTASLDLFVSSSAWEGLPIAVIEALAVRTPVVATDVGGTSELVIQGKTGDLVPPRNPQMLAAAILSVLSRPRRDTDAARNLALRISDAAAAAHSLDAILHEAATRPSSSMV